MLKLALTHHGHSVTLGQTSHPLTSTPSESRTWRPQNTVGPNSNGLDDFPPVVRTSECAVDAGTQQAEQQEGVYL